MSIRIEDLSDADIEALLEAVAGDERQWATLNALLATIAGLSGTVERLERRNYLNQAALDAVGNTLADAISLDRLRMAFDAPDKAVDMQLAAARATELATAVRQQANSGEAFATIAKLGLGIAKALI